MIDEHSWKPSKGLKVRVISHGGFGQSLLQHDVEKTGGWRLALSWMIYSITLEWNKTYIPMHDCPTPFVERFSWASWSILGWLRGSSFPPRTSYQAASYPWLYIELSPAQNLKVVSSFHLSPFRSYLLQMTLLASFWPTLKLVAFANPSRRDPEL